MIAKKYFTVTKSILFASMMFLLIGCDKTSTPTGGSSTGTVDAALVGVWFDISDSTGSEIKSDGTVIPLQVQNNFLVAINIGTETINISASGGNYTLTRKTKVEGTSRDTTITTNGTYTVSGTTLTVTDPSGTMILTKSAYGVNVFTYTGGGGGGGGGFTTAGLMSFTSDKGNFTANGIYNGNATTGSGVGAMTSSGGGSYMLQVTGYRVNSATSIDIAVMTFINSSPIATGTYTSSSAKMVMIYYFPAMNPADTSENFYMLTTATANISAITSSNAAGTFSGSGMYSANGTLVPSNGISVSDGTFNVPVVPLLNVLQNPVDKKIERIIKRIESFQ